MNNRTNSHKVHLLAATRAMLFSEEMFAAHYHDLLVRDRQQAKDELARVDGRPHPSTPEGERLQSNQARDGLKAALLSTFIVALTAVLVAIGIAFFLEVLHPTLPSNMGKVLQTIGGGFGLWGTLFALRSPPKSLGGASVPEQVHGFLFTTILGSGGALGIAGTLL